MAEQSIVQEGVGRVSDALDSIGDEIQRVQKQLRSRRRTLEKRIETNRKSFEKRARRQANRLRTELGKNPVWKRARAIQEDAAKQIESGVDGVLTFFQIASKSDVQRIDRKLSQINRKLKELERTRKANGAGASA